MTTADEPAPRTWLGRLVQIRPGEGASIAWATALFFLLLCANFTLRPVREALGIERGADDLPLVWTGTLTLSLLVQPVFATLLARTRRRTFVPLVYGIGIAFLLAFRAAFEFAPAGWKLGIGYAFYVWFSVFNVFSLSVFWGFAADLFRLEQAQRLFAFVSVGGTVGALCGSTLAKELARPFGTVNLIFVGCGLLVLATGCVVALVRLHPEDAPREPSAAAATGAADPRSAWRGLAFIARSPYLQGICAFTLFHTLFGTVLYFQQANLVSAALTERNERTAYFATVDQIANALTLFLQLFVTGRLIQRLGTGFALVTQPLVAGAACLGLGGMILYGTAAFGDGWTHAWPPSLVAVAAARVLLSAANYATAKPARESLFTVVPKAAKYASKSFVDTFVYRAGDLIGAWTFDLFAKTLGVALGTIALGAAPLALVWLGVGVALGRRQRDLSGGGPG
ncbi:MAG: MFS transporter [Planctomycetes bacterium]|nr:MFS transporter [Planctomycetota bacterium]